MRKHFKAGALTAPLPPVLVTVGDMENANIITIGWTGILSTIPPRTYISVRPERYSYKLLKEKREFVINLPRATQAWEVDYAGIYTGAKVDKFRECGFTKTQSAEVGAPSIAECPVALECRVVEIIPMGTHDVFISDIVSVSCDGSVLDEDGKMRFDKADLLAYAHGEYFSLGDKVGVFGFSTKTPKGKRFVEKVKTAPESKRTAGASGRKGQSKTRAENKSKIAERAPRRGGVAERKENTESEGARKKPFYLDIKNKAKRGGGKKRK